MTMVACCCFSGTTWVYLVTGVGVKDIYIYIFVVWWGNWMKESLQKSHLRSLLPKLYCRGISNCIMYVRMYVCFWLFKYTYTWYMSIFLLFTIAFAIIIITRAWFVAILLSSQWSFQADRRGWCQHPCFSTAMVVWYANFRIYIRRIGWINPATSVEQ